MTPLEIVEARLAVYRKVQAKRDPFGPNDRNGHEATGDIIMALEIVRDQIKEESA